MRVTRPPASGWAPVRALVADDNAINRQVLIRQLEVLGLACVAVASAAEALAALQDERFDLLITDLYMPGMNGADLASRVRATATIPVVLLTARADMQYAEASPGSPFDAVLIKPVSVDTLRSCLWRLLPASARQLAASATPDAQADPLPAFDLRQLDALAAHGIDLHTFAKDWRRSVEDDLAQIEALVRRNDPDGVRERLHSLSGAVGLVGARELMDVLDRAGTASPTFMMRTVESLAERVRSLIRQVDAHDSGT